MYNEMEIGNSINDRVWTKGHNLKWTEINVPIRMWGSGYLSTEPPLMVWGTISMAINRSIEYVITNRWN